MVSTNGVFPRIFASLINLEGLQALREYVPDLKYYLCDLQDYNPIEIGGEVRLRAVLLAMKYVFRPDLVEKLIEILGLFNEFPAGDPEAVELVRIILLYLSKARDLSRDDVKTALEESVSREVKNAVANVFDEYRQEGIELGIKQGLQQGLREGMEQGEQRGFASANLQLLRARLGPLDPDLEKAILAMPLDLLQNLGDMLLRFNSPADVAIWIKRHSQ